MSIINSVYCLLYSLKLCSFCNSTLAACKLSLLTERKRNRNLGNFKLRASSTAHSVHGTVNFHVFVHRRFLKLGLSSDIFVNLLSTELVTVKGLKADVSSVSPSSERIRSGEALKLETSAQSLNRGLLCLISSPKFCVSLPQQLTPLFISGRLVVILGSYSEIFERLPIIRK